MPLPLVNQIRPRVKAWREAGYPGVTGMTRRLLEHWSDPGLCEGRRFFFCQLEAIETLIWLTEAPAATPGHRGAGRRRAFPPLCAKMATGSGKTIVMAMLIAWHVLNKWRILRTAVLQARARHRPWAHGEEPARRCSCPIRGTTTRLRHRPVGAERAAAAGPGADAQLALLNWESDEQIARRRSVDKRGAKSDAAYVRTSWATWPRPPTCSSSTTRPTTPGASRPRRRCGAWRRPTSRRPRAGSAAWTASTGPGHPRLPRLLGHALRPSGKESSEEALFGWIVSDFGLNDAIESGLVKTPRVVVRDDGMPRRTLPIEALPHLPVGARRPEPEGGGARAAARPRDQRLLPARQGLAGDGEAVGGGRACRRRP